MLEKLRVFLNALNQKLLQTNDSWEKSLFYLVATVVGLALSLLWVAIMVLFYLSLMPVKLLMLGVGRINGLFNTGKI